MSGKAMHWAMSLPRRAIPNSPARAVLVALAWTQKGEAPVYASLAHLSETTSFEVKAVRRALTWLLAHEFIEPTGTSHRNMPFYRIKTGPRPLPNPAGVNGSQPLPNPAGFDDFDPYRIVQRPLPHCPLTPTASVTQTSKPRLNKGPVVCMGERDERDRSVERENTENRPLERVHAAIAQAWRKT